MPISISSTKEPMPNGISSALVLIMGSAVVLIILRSLIWRDIASGREYWLLDVLNICKGNNVSPVELTRTITL